MGDFTALETFLIPIYQILDSSDTILELSINKPCDAWIEDRGDMINIEAPELTKSHLLSIARLIAQSTSQFLDEAHPILSATLPNGYRVQIIIPPAASEICMSIRKPSILQLTLDDYSKAGAFDDIISKPNNKDNKKIKELYDEGKIQEMLKLCILTKKNLIISGGTSTGKTTFANALFLEIPSHERLITIEDAREVQLPNHRNRLHLLASKGGQGLAKVTVQNLMESCLRLRPDRIIVGELRGAEAFSYMRAVNTGHPGSIATLHADSPIMAIEQLKLMIMQSGIGLSGDEIREYVMNIVEVVVQLKRTGSVRHVSDILLNLS